MCLFQILAWRFLWTVGTMESQNMPEWLSLHFTTFSQSGCWMAVMEWFLLLLFLFLLLKLLLTPPSCLFFLYLLPIMEQIIKNTLHGRHWLRSLLIKTLVNKVVQILTSWSSYSGGVRLIQPNKRIVSDRCRDFREQNNREESYKHRDDAVLDPLGKRQVRRHLIESWETSWRIHKVTCRNSPPGRGNSMCEDFEVGADLAEKLLFPFPLILFPLLLLLFLLLELSSFLSSSVVITTTTTVFTKTFMAHTVLGLSVMEKHLGELLHGGVNSLFLLVSSHQGLLNASILSLMFWDIFPSFVHLKNYSFIKALFRHLDLLGNFLDTALNASTFKISWSSSKNTLRKIY